MRAHIYLSVYMCVFMCLPVNKRIAFPFLQKKNEARNTSISAGGGVRGNN